MKDCRNERQPPNLDANILRRARWDLFPIAGEILVRWRLLPFRYQTFSSSPIAGWRSRTSNP
jgi:hypothetical protein